MPLLNKLQFSDGARDYANFSTGAHQVSPGFLKALEFYPDFQQQLHWVQCLITMGHDFDCAMSHLGLRAEYELYMEEIAMDWNDEAASRRENEIRDQCSDMVFKRGALRVVRAARKAYPRLARKIYRTGTHSGHHAGVGNTSEKAVVLCQKSHALNCLNDKEDDEFIRYVGTFSPRSR